MADDPLGMSEDDMNMFLSGGAEPGSKTHEQAKAALAIRLANQKADAASTAVEGTRRWAMIAAGSAAITATVGLIALLIQIL